MSITERVFELLENQRKSQADLADFLKINPANVARWKARNSNIPAVYILPIAKFLERSVVFILTGKESVTETDADERVLALFHSLSEEGREKAIEQLEFFATRYSKKSHKDKLVG